MQGFSTATTGMKRFTFFLLSALLAAIVGVVVMAGGVAGASHKPPCKPYCENKPPHVKPPKPPKCVKKRDDVRFDVEEESDISKMQFFVGKKLVKTIYGPLGGSIITLSTQINFKSIKPRKKAVLKLVATDELGNVGSGAAKVKRCRR